MADISIDRLSLTVPGFSAPRSERLVRQIVDGLADASLSPGPPADVSALTLSLCGVSTESDDALVGRIVAELIRQLDSIS
jgi:hypothetical protein